jgi:hypothetical protein
LVVRGRSRRRLVLERRTRCGTWIAVRRVRAGRSYRLAPGLYRLRAGALRSRAIELPDRVL